MNIEKFRSDFQLRRTLQGGPMLDVASACNVDFAIISRFAAGKRGLSFENVIKLWPFVYGHEFPSPPSPTASPKTAPEHAQEQSHD